MSALNWKPKRRVKISKQRQITIPKDFYDALNFSDEAFVEYNGKEIVIRPAGDEVVDFSEDILQDLIAKGLSGEELLEQFRVMKSEIPHALERMKQEAMERPSVEGSLSDYLDATGEDEADE
ncbi:AbrB/MazE/SpoVT family DNA-binding domain-containing protein [Weizmannia sp. FSL W8-0676]|uniref:AbrB/MazE/SpoVT family DNA-binding domain-containing protein n=1 Tax=Weizmannia sp. FSL W8-0676 TaxID=2954703 RepID=UPI00315915A8